MKQCEATTRASTYSASHRCVKKAVKKAGKTRYCSHHGSAQSRRPA